MKPLIKECLILLNIAGQDPTNQDVWGMIRLAISLISMAAVVVELFLEVILHWSGLDSVAAIAYFMAFYQMSSRGVTLVVYRRTFATVLNMVKTFWTPNRYRSDGNVERGETNAQVTYRIARKIMKIFFIIYLMCVIFFFGVFPMQREPLVQFYHIPVFTKSPDYEMRVLMSFFAVGFCVAVMVGFDFLYAGIIIHVIYELKIIKQKLRTLPINLEVKGDDGGCLKELATMIDRHNFVLKFIKKLNQIYSIVLLNQFVTSMVSFASILVAITTNSATITYGQYSIYVLYIYCYTTQLFFFCLGGSFLTTECASVADAAYECQWWLKTQPKLRKSIVLIIQRTQKMEVLSAGGFFPVNLQSFTSVVNTAGSFFSVMLAAYRDRDED